tara:strand:- start:5440 stop:6054 length:615 start_codon:yes stop_codon:yes gene_type:complete
MPKKKEVFEANGVEEEVVEKPATPKKNKETPEERKERLKAQLAKGREKALANRKKNALAKKVARKEEEDKKDALLAEKLLGQESAQKEILELKEELKALKEAKKEATEERKEVKSIEEKKEKTSEINDLKKQINLLAGVVDRLIKEKNKDKIKMEYRNTEEQVEEEPKVEKEVVVAPPPRPPTPQAPQLKVFDVTHSFKKPRFL